MRHKPNRKGFSLVELQISFLVFAIGVAGLGPLVVMQSRHLTKIESRFNANNTYYLSPSNDDWARKLGAGASITPFDPGPRATSPILVMDDSDTSFVTVGEDWNPETNESYQGNCQKHIGGDGTAIARWEFTGLPAGWYDVRATWHEDDMLTTAAPFTVYEGTENKGETPIDQQVAPSGEVIDGKPWQSLKIVSITSGTLTVELTDASADPVVADAIRLIPLKNDIQINSLEKSLSNEDVTAHVTVTVQVPQ